MGFVTYRLVIAAALGLAIQLLAGGTPASGAALSRSELQAAFLVNFTKFVSWPAAAFSSGSAPIVIGIVGEDPFGPAIDAAVRGQRVNDRAIEVWRAGLRDDFSRFHVLFVGTSEARQLESLLRRLDGTHVLTVSDIERFCAAGGAIGFVAHDGRVRFEINVGAADARGLKISTRLLGLAAKVHTP